MKHFVVKMTEKLRIGSKNHYVFTQQETIEDARVYAKTLHPDFWLKDSWERKPVPKHKTWPSGAY